MIDITKAASTEIRRQSSPETPVRMRIDEFGRSCNGPLLRLTQDAPLPGDRIHREDGFELAVDSRLEKELGDIRIDYNQSPFGGGSFAIGPLVNLACGGCGDCRC